MKYVTPFQSLKNSCGCWKSLDPSPTFAPQRLSFSRTLLLPYHPNIFLGLCILTVWPSLLLDPIIHFLRWKVASHTKIFCFCFNVVSLPKGILKGTAKKSSKSNVKAAITFITNCIFAVHNSARILSSKRYVLTKGRYCAGASPEQLCITDFSKTVLSSSKISMLVTNWLLALVRENMLLFIGLCTSGSFVLKMNLCVHL